MLAAGLGLGGRLSARLAAVGRSLGDGRRLSPGVPAVHRRLGAPVVGLPALVLGIEHAAVVALNFHVR